jgi:hypothetical protein
MKAMSNKAKSISHSSGALSKHKERIKGNGLTGIKVV